MSGFGERFRRAGYSTPKPLIEVDGHPIIKHVLDMFPGEKNVLFICNEDHLRDSEYRLSETLRSLCPNGRIASIKPHKLGPVYAVAEAFEYLDPDEPTIVNYCDFTCLWDYEAFKAFVVEKDCDGAVACYRGFHPHMLRNHRYAYVNETDGWINAIREKQPFTNAPMDEFASSGTYYFRSGSLVKECFSKTILRDDLKLAGEYYVSLAYRTMLEEGRRVAVFELQRFMQWGTPEDLEEYEHWSQVFRGLVERPDSVEAPGGGTTLIPMAGLGERFAREGYDKCKPLIPVSGRPMAVQAVRDLPATPSNVFVLRSGMAHREDVEEALAAQFANCRFVRLEAPTDGQARTCLLGLEGVDLDAPLTIGACDNGLLYDRAEFVRFMEGEECDVVVWSARNHPGALRNPEMYGWVDADSSGRIKRVSVKVPLDNPAEDPIITGVFTFRRARDFVTSAERMIDRDGRINGEFYVDECISDAIAMGLDCRALIVDAYLCWGTPDDLRTYEYWQSCFHHWDSHPYRTGDDPRYVGVPPRLDRITWRSG